MGKKFGQRMTFWQLLKESKIVIPTIQRDYTYGAQTFDTDKVLNHLLSDIHEALFDDNAPVLTLDFVYGSRNINGEFMPLDGQQRLTTLFLLHYYAAPLNILSDNDRQYLSKFSYATRESSKEFCEHLLGEGFAPEWAGNIRPSEQIRNESFYLPTFDDDPTVRSMLVVLDCIHSKFWENRGTMWNLLTHDECKINFDALNFEQFGLSDDLYIKMNARGKPLTEFEIFKSKFERHIEGVLGYDKDDKDFEREISRKLDTDWSDLIWTERNEDELLIDESYIFLFKNILSLRRWQKNEKRIVNILDIKETVKDRSDIDFIVKIFDVFSDEHQRTNDKIDFSWREVFYVDKETVSGVDDDEHRIRAFVRNAECFFLTALKCSLDMSDMLRFYGFFKWLESDRSEDSLRAVRHLRNLVENSPDEIREDRMYKLLKDTDSLFDGSFITKQNPLGFNVTQWHEELSKAAEPEKWKALYGYENSLLLRGALACFIEGEGPFELSDANKFEWMVQALKGMDYVFSSKEDHNIRKALMTYGDFSQSPVNHPHKHMLGCRFEHWREMLVKSSRRSRQDKIVKILNRIEISDTPFSGVEYSDVENWRYYFVKYSEYTYFTSSGYYFLADDGDSLEIISMNSSVHSDNNLEWRLLNVLLKRYVENIGGIIGIQSLEIDPHGSKPININGKVRMTVRQSGWEIVDGLDLIRTDLEKEGIALDESLCRRPPKTDAVEFGKKIICVIGASLSK